MSRIDETKEFIPVRIAVLTVSDTRTLEDDRSGQTLVDRIAEAGHCLPPARSCPTSGPRSRRSCGPGRRSPHRRGADDRRHRADGPRRDGRGASRRLREGDRGLRDRLHHRVDAEDRHLAVQSRACGGVANGTYLFALPGSPGACRDAWDEILVAARLSPPALQLRRDPAAARRTPATEIARNTRNRMTVAWRSGPPATYASGRSGTNPMRFLRRSLIGVFLLSLTAGLFALAGQIVYGALETRWSAEAPQPPARERVVAVNVMTVAPTAVAPVLETFGEVRSRRTLDLRSASGGTVLWVADSFEDGGTVTAGQLLAQVDPADAQSALDVARAGLSEAEANLRDAERSILLARDELASAEEQARLRARALDRQRTCWAAAWAPRRRSRRPSSRCPRRAGGARAAAGGGAGRDADRPGADGARAAADRAGRGRAAARRHRDHGAVHGRPVGRERGRGRARHAERAAGADHRSRGARGDVPRLDLAVRAASRRRRAGFRAFR
jgi:hypothetical protein